MSRQSLGSTCATDDSFSSIDDSGNAPIAPVRTTEPSSDAPPLQRAHARRTTPRSATQPPARKPLKVWNARPQNDEQQPVERRQRYFCGLLSCVWDTVAWFFRGAYSMMCFFSNLFLTALGFGYLHLLTLCRKETVAKKKQIDQVQRPNRAPLPVLVLDLDGTLVCTRACYDAADARAQRILVEESAMYVSLRPHLREFLDAVSQTYCVYLYTASEKAYADAVLQVIDPDQKYFAKRFYRNHCRQEPDVCAHKYTKSLATLNVPLCSTVFVDDNVYAVQEDIANSIIIKEFAGTSDDSELLKMACLLKDIARDLQATRVDVKPLIEAAKRRI